MRSFIWAIYKSTLPQDTFGIKAAHAACARLPQLPVEVWDEIGLWVVQESALRWCATKLLELRLVWHRVCELELEGDHLMALLPNRVEEVLGHPIIAALHSHLGQCVGARLEYEYWAEMLFGMCHDLGHPQLEVAFKADTWVIRQCIRGYY